MVWHSTRESVENGEISVLAIIETVLAVSVSFWLAISLLESWWPMLIGVCLAPFLLLRTERATELGLRWLDSSLKWFMSQEDTFSGLLHAYQDLGKSFANGLGMVMGRFQPSPVSLVPYLFLVLSCLVIGIIFLVLVFFFSVFILILLLVVFAALVIVIRTASVVYSALHHPGKALVAIPANWRNVALSTDSFLVPETIAGIESGSIPKNLEQFRISGIVNAFKASNTAPQGIYSTITGIYIRLYWLHWSILLIFISFPYRYSLKATTIVWLPLIWTIRQGKPQKLSERLRTLNKTSWGRFASVFSGIILLLFGTKLLLFHAIVSFQGWWNALRVVPFFDQIVAPYTLPPWQIASVANSGLTLVLYFLASHGLMLLVDEGHQEEDLWPYDWTARIGAVVRTALSLYTSSCLLYIVASQLPEWNLPPIEDRLFPWVPLE